MDYKEYIAEHREETLALLRTLAVIPAPSGHEEKRAEWIREWLQKRGARNVSIDSPKNVIWKWKEEPGKPFFLLSAHTDVVFDDRETLPLREDEQKIYVPGIGDDTASVVNLLMAASYFLETGTQPAEPLLLVFNSCEEGLGNLKGMRQIYRDYQIRGQIAFDHHDMHSLLTTPVGSRRFSIRIQADGGHSYRDFGRDNAIVQMAALVGELYRIRVPEGGTTTYNVGTIQGGSTVNSIAENCQILYEFRSQDPGQLEYMQKKLDEALEKSRCRGVRLQAEAIGDRPCQGAVPEEERKTLTDRIEKILCRHTTEQVVRCPGSTDCNIPLSLGIPALTCGIYRGGGCHTREEWVDKASLCAGQEIAAEILLPLMQGSSISGRISQP